MLLIFFFKTLFLISLFLLFTVSSGSSDSFGISFYMQKIRLRNEKYQASSSLAKSENWHCFTYLTVLIYKENMDI